MLAGAAQAAEIHVVVIGALTAPFRQVVPAFEQATGSYVYVQVKVDSTCLSVCTPRSIACSSTPA